MYTIDELKKEIKEKMKILNGLQEKHEKEVQLPEMIKLIGTCWKYKNCYSCPEKKSDYWWEYYMIIGVKDTWAYDVINCSSDSRNIVTIKKATLEIGGWGGNLINCGYKKISRSVFIRAFKSRVNMIIDSVESH